MAQLIPTLGELGPGGPLNDDFKLATVTHVNIGERTFGVAPGEATICVTLRTGDDSTVSNMVTNARDLAETAAKQFGLEVRFVVFDKFAASVNNPDATAVAFEALDGIGISNGTNGVPMYASEDFGVFGWDAKAAMLCLGSGENHPALHNPDYDFPDDLIPVGASIFDRIARDILG